MSSRFGHRARLSEIRPEIGFAYIAPTHRPALSAHIHPSSAFVLEDDTPLPGPANALHEDIRQKGRGRYCFWHDSVYFSTSDNSDPNTNGRCYEIAYANASRFIVSACLQKIGDLVSMAQHSRQPAEESPINLQTRNSAPENLQKDVEYAVQVGGCWMRLLSEARLSLDGKVVLEIGPGINFGSTLLLACLGAQAMVADRFLAPWDDNYHPRFYAMLRAWIERNHPEADLRPLDAILSQGRYCAESIRCHATPLERLSGIHDASVDVIFSNAVLEHLAHPKVAFKQLARVSKSGAIGFHQVDFRDHNDFSNPLEFLLNADRAFAKEFTQRHGERGNRYRPMEYAAFLKNEGFRVRAFSPTCLAEEAYLANFVPRLRRAVGSKYQNENVLNLREISGLFCVEKI